MGAMPVPGPTMTTGTDGSVGRLNVDGRTCTIMRGHGARPGPALLSSPSVRFPLRVDGGMHRAMKLEHTPLKTRSSVPGLRCSREWAQP